MFGLIGQIAGSLLNPITNAIQGNQNRIAQRKANESNLAFAQKQLDFNMDMAKNGIQHRVQDAEAAGINPLVAMGASTYSGGGSVGSAGQQPYLGNELSNMGIGLTDTVKSLTSLTRKKIESEINENDARAAYWKSQATGISGTRPQTDTAGGEIKIEPMRTVTRAKDDKSSEPGSLAYRGWVETTSGLKPAPSGAFKERFEDTFVETEHNLKNRLGMGKQPPKSIWQKRWPKAKGIHFNYAAGEWQPTYKKYTDDYYKKPRPSSSNMFEDLFR